MASVKRLLQHFAALNEQHFCPLAEILKAALSQYLYFEDCVHHMLTNFNLNFRCPDETFGQLRRTSSHTIECHGIKATKLCTHKDDVEEVNSNQLKNLKGELKVFYSVDSDASYADQMDKLLPVKNKIQLKVGAQVILFHTVHIRNAQSSSCF